jgi:hypothetical protein
VVGLDAVVGVFARVMRWVGQELVDDVQQRGGEVGRDLPWSTAPLR